MADKFFSETWGPHAQDMWNTSPAVQGGLSDPDSFTYFMEMGVVDRDVRCEIEFSCGKCVYWGKPRRASDDCDFQIWATLAIWQQVASGQLNAVVALSSRQLEFRKGPVSEAIRNATAFEGVMVGMGSIDTDWDI
ncbi:MAG: hypothetical protein ACYCV7_04265 [Acidimicrobiales bacterium]